MRRNLSLIFVATLGLYAAFGIAGCGAPVKGGGQDVGMISETPSKKAVSPGSGALWALPTGKVWRTLTARPQQQNVNSEIRVIGAYRVKDGRTGTMVRSSRTGKMFRVEVYQTSPQGAMKLLALGESEKKLLVFTPAIPVFNNPVKEGKYERWNGTAQIDGKEYTASAFHRISASEDIKTPFETLKTYRLDGIITLLNGEQRIDYPAVMWFVPGKGIAQRRLADRGTLALEVITKF